MNSYDVRFWQIETRRGKTVTYRVRWVVAGRRFSDSFTTKELAESLPSEAAGGGQAGRRVRYRLGAARVDGSHAAGRVLLRALR